MKHEAWREKAITFMSKQLTKNLFVVSTNIQWGHKWFEKQTGGLLKDEKPRERNALFGGR
jgi:hypothetical protein